MSNNLQRSESVTTPAKEASVPRQRTILHIDHTDAVLAFTSVFLTGMATGIIVVHL